MTEETIDIYSRITGGDISDLIDIDKISRIGYAGITLHCPIGSDPAKMYIDVNTDHYDWWTIEDSPVLESKSLVIILTSSLRDRKLYLAHAQMSPFHIDEDRNGTGFIYGDLYRDKS